MAPRRIFRQSVADPPTPQSGHDAILRALAYLRERQYRKCLTTTVTRQADRSCRGWSGARARNAARTRVKSSFVVIIAATSERTARTKARLSLLTRTLAAHPRSKL